MRNTNTTPTTRLLGLVFTNSDPCTDNDGQYGWLDLGVDFAWQKGLIDQDVYTKLTLAPGLNGSCTSARTKVSALCVCICYTFACVHCNSAVVLSVRVNAAATH